MENMDQRTVITQPAPVRRGNKGEKTMEYKMIKAGEESTITEADAVEIIGAENFDIAKEGLSWQQDDVEIFFNLEV